MISLLSKFRRPSTINAEPSREFGESRVPAQADYPTDRRPESSKARFPRQNPDSSSESASLIFKKAQIDRHGGFRPGYTALRKTPRGWLSSNLIRKDHAGSVLVARITIQPPFLVGVYDLAVVEKK